ncbi:MAG: XRE family transcriptional regulator [Bacteriovoracia bacterium]
MKYQICTEIIRFKKKSNLTQSALADMIGINKSEVSKLFSYQLDAFSSDRLLQMVRALQANGAEISYETIFDDVRRKVGVIDRKPKVR